MGKGEETQLRKKVEQFKTKQLETERSEVRLLDVERPPLEAEHSAQLEEPEKGIPSRRLLNGDENTLLCSCSILLVLIFMLYFLFGFRRRVKAVRVRALKAHRV